MTAVPTSRRAILSGLAALPALATAASAHPDTGDALNRLFVRWQAAHAEIAAVPTELLTDERLDAMCDVVAGIEAEMRATPPSLMRAAMDALVVIRDGSHTTDSTVSSLLADLQMDSARFALSILASLRPGLSGPLAACVADLLDNPDRALFDSKLFRGDA